MPCAFQLWIGQELFHAHTQGWCLACDLGPVHLAPTSAIWCESVLLSWLCSLSLLHQLQRHAAHR
jgi:hypothetical protein